MGKRLSSGKKQNYTIELLRFLVSICVMNHHFFHIDYGVFNVSESVNNFFFKHGNLGVEFFFLVSGFLMAASAQRIWSSEQPIESVGKTSIVYVLKKAAAVVVPVYVTWIFCFLITHIVQGQFTFGKLLKDGLNSIFELLFLRSAGYGGYYCVGQIWYISAMLLAMLICFPLLLKLRKTYLYVIAPLAALLILGFLDHQYSGLMNTSEYVGILYKHFLRAIGEINLGVVCFVLASLLKKVKFTGFGMVVLSLIEIGCYAGALFYMNWKGLGYMDVLFCFLMAIGILITFSQHTLLNCITEKFPAICRFLGKSSLYIYLSHVVICRQIVPLLCEKIDNDGIVYGVGIAIIFAFTIILWILSAFTQRCLLPFLKAILVKQGSRVRS